MKPKDFSIVDKLAGKYKKKLAFTQKEMKKPAKKKSEIYHRFADIALFQKWAYRVGKGWYGFSLGNIPRVWGNMLDEFFA